MGIHSAKVKGKLLYVQAVVLLIRTGSIEGVSLYAHCVQFGESILLLHTTGEKAEGSTKLIDFSNCEYF